MKTISVQMSEVEYDTLRLSKDRFYFSDRVLTDFIADRNRKSLKDLKGKISFMDDNDYKLMRN